MEGIRAVRADGTIVCRGVVFDVAGQGLVTGDHVRVEGVDVTMGGIAMLRHCGAEHFGLPVGFTPREERKLRAEGLLPA